MVVGEKDGTSIPRLSYLISTAKSTAFEECEESIKPYSTSAAKSEEETT